MKKTMILAACLMIWPTIRAQQAQNGEQLPVARLEQQVLMLENAHADGVAVFTVDKELVNQLAFHHKAQLTVEVNRFFVLFIDNQVKLVEIQNVEPVIHRQLRCP